MAALGSPKDLTSAQSHRCAQVTEVGHLVPSQRSLWGLSRSCLARPLLKQSPPAPDSGSFLKPRRSEIEVTACQARPSQLGWTTPWLLVSP